MQRIAKTGIAITALAVAAALLAVPSTYSSWSSVAVAEGPTITGGIVDLTVGNGETRDFTIPKETLKKAVTEKQTVDIAIHGIQQGNRGLYFGLAGVTVAAENDGLIRVLDATVYSAPGDIECAKTSPSSLHFSGKASELSRLAIAPQQLVDTAPHSASDSEKTSDEGDARLCITLALPERYGEYSNTGTATASGTGKTQNGASTRVDVSGSDAWHATASPPDDAYDVAITFSFEPISVRPGQSAATESEDGE